MRDCTFGIFFLQQSSIFIEARLTRRLSKMLKNRNQKHQNVGESAKQLSSQFMFTGTNIGEYTWLVPTNFKQGKSSKKKSSKVAGVNYQPNDSCACRIIALLTVHPFLYHKKEHASHKKTTYYYIVYYKQIHALHQILSQILNVFQ